jgi:YVTN family beta-propeller protein
VDGRRLDLGGPRPRALLAILVLRLGEVVPIERLADELWGETPPKSAHHLLHVYVSNLRKELGGRLVTRAPGYVLELEPDDLDARRFGSLFAHGTRQLAAGDPAGAAKTLRKALALWHGPALADFTYEPFAKAEIGRLEELRLVAIEERIEADLALGGAAELVGELEALIGEHPLRERLRGQLMLALYRGGRQADALAAYQDTRRALVDELGLEPSEELQRVERAILTHDPTLTPAPRASHVQAATADASGPSAGPMRRLRVLAAAGSLLVAVGIAAATTRLTRDSESAPLVVAPDSVAIVDPKTNRVVGQVPVGARPVSVVVGHGSVWVANADDGTVSRIDPRIRQVVKTIGIGAPVSDLAVSASGIWVASGSEGTVSQIDPESNAVVGEVDLRGPNPLAPRPVHAVAAGAGAIWATSGDDSVVRIEPATNKVTAQISVPSAPVDLAANRSAVWVELVGERLLRIEPRTNGVTAAVPIGDPVGVATGVDAVWIADLRGAISRVDPVTVAVTDTVRVGAELSAVALGHGALWVANPVRGQVIRVDPRTTGVTGTIGVGNVPTDVAVGDGSVWITVRSWARPDRPAKDTPAKALRPLQIPLRVGLVLDTAGVDEPYLGGAYAGLKRAVEELGVKGRVLIRGPKESFLPAFSHLARQRFDLVIGVGFFSLEDIDAAALRFPDQRFVVIDAAWEDLPHRPRNVVGMTFRVEEASYLAGNLAALVEEGRPGADVVSSVGGVKIPTVDAFIAGYVAGARKASPRITWMNAYAQSFLDRSKCRAAALSQIAKGSGAVFQVASACGLGALDAAKRTGVFGIGVDIDQSALGPHVLTSVVKRLDVAVQRAIRSAQQGRLEFGTTVTLGLRERGVGLGRVSRLVPDSLLARIDAVRRQILAGRIARIPTTVP